ncbi:hypothetical protein CAP35_13870 [Chitinophagaceae bacterium IBVUCB1]|nr:hypothetical protein CAP35_13870 [Chitinophagaceae bacterium IBVUCB1]
MSEATKVNKLTDEQKQRIASLIKNEIRRLGTQKKVAIKCGVSDAAIDQLKTMKYQAQGDDMWIKVGNALGWKEDTWKIAYDTIDSKSVFAVLKDAKENSLFIPIAQSAGGGKSSGIEAFMNQQNSNVFYISCKEWNKRELLYNLCIALGVDPSPGYPQDMLLEKVIDFFKVRQNKPLLIIDQANSLKPSVLTFLIFLYNECEDRLGVVIAGTEELEKKIKKGVRLSYKGYDELDSRLGRRYVKLTGATLSCVRKICAINGITDPDVQAYIFDKCMPVLKEVDSNGTPTKVKVVTDKRLIKRAVKAWKIQNQED